jgi:hypothetical protein
VNDDVPPGDPRAERREQRRKAERERMQKHGARTAELYRNAILKRLRKNAGSKASRNARRRGT